jgi:hypothetical protein
MRISVTPIECNRAVAPYKKMRYTNLTSKRNIQWLLKNHVFRLNDSNFPSEIFLLFVCEGDDDTVATATDVFVLDGEATREEATAALAAAFLAINGSDFDCKADRFGDSLMSPDLFFFKKLGKLFRCGNTDLSVTSNPCCMIDPGMGRSGPT